MKNILKSINICLFLAILLVTSCSETPKALPKCLLTSYGDVALSYSDADKVILFNKLNVSLDTKGNIIKVQPKSADVNRIELTYDAKGKLSQYIFFTDTLVSGKYVFEYNAHKQVTKITQFDVNDYTLNYYTFEYADTTTRNILVEKFYSGDYLTETHFEYDNKKNPWTVLPQVWELMLIYQDFYYLWGDNNVTKKTVTQGANTWVYSRSYTYNDKGYPTKQSEVFADNAPFEITYTYLCSN